ncbi:MAG: RNHCP domain-containing protein [Candidatus Andersenbacteria bacterium]
MAFIVRGRNEGFTCERCSVEVPPHPSSCRNHCPRCLWSKHVDDVAPGDRASSCGGLMALVGVERGRRDAWRLVHRCQRCGEERACVAAPDDDAAQAAAVAERAALG